MMERLAEQVTEGMAAPDLVLGDATRLPLADASFGVVLSFHVLHLVPDWEPAVEEAVRALAPGGAFIHYQRKDEYAWQESGDKWDELLGARGFERRKRLSIEEIVGKLESLGGSCRLLEVAREEERMTPNGILELTRSRAHSWSWEIPDDLFWGCMPEYEEWMRWRYADMDEVVVNPIVHELRVWTWESGRA
jgi:SAM-dependent methyltransferase